MFSSESFAQAQYDPAVQIRNQQIQQQRNEVIRPPDLQPSPNDGAFKHSVTRYSGGRKYLSWGYDTSSRKWAVEVRNY